MTTQHRFVFLATFSVVLLSSCRSLPSGVPDEYKSPIEAEAYLAGVNLLDSCARPDTPCEVQPGAALENISVDENTGRLEIAYNEFLGYRPIRPEGVAYMYGLLAERMSQFGHLQTRITSGGFEISELVPNMYRDQSLARDNSRVPSRPDIPAIVRPASGPMYSSGLSGRHIAVWPSHGWYYEHRLNRWEWQRARLFQTVEDLLPFSFVIPYLAPMLENAGANVFIPRERDVQTEEVIVDNDDARSNWIEPDSTAWSTGAGPGFATGNPPYNSRDRPFESGTFRQAAVTSMTTGSLIYLPNIPEAGEYAVYVSYASVPGSTTDAHYTVNYSGGSRRLLVNQQIGGGTWIYLGTYHFHSGENTESGSVILTTEATTGSVVTADAVRFGGGMGNIARNGQTSGRPRYVEGARYYLQYAGMPDSLVFDVTDGETNDYVDDYRGRGEWVNYMRGNPYGPNKDLTRGLGIPVDLSLAFHTDAGVTRRDTTIGTLLIYSTPGMDSTGVFPDGVSRLANRDFSDILQTQITSDIRSLYDSTWTRRAMWDKDYSEAHRPNVPSALLELLSHQNFEDMRFGLDPRFKFTASRSIYKSMLKYLADAYGYQATVQPLPVTHMRSDLNPDGTVTLAWDPAADPLEPTAIPTGYRLYTSKDSAGYDTGISLSSTSYTTASLMPGVVYRFRVTATNDGGESFPSTTVSAGIATDSATPILIVDAFDRISAPAAIQTDEITGFLPFLDEGVPFISDMAYTGPQYDFEFDSAWLDDDSPGHGASHSNYEARIVAGNTFDFSRKHGEALLALGHSFVTSSDEAVRDGYVDLSRFEVVDYLLGEERTTKKLGSSESFEFQTFDGKIRDRLTEYLDSGGNLLVSGAYVGTDSYRGYLASDSTAEFLASQLGIVWRTDHAATTGEVDIVSATGLPAEEIQYQAAFDDTMYKVESPDAIEPATEAGRTFLRYAENNMSAGVLYDGGSSRVVTIGFPIETIGVLRERVELFRTTLDYLDGNTKQTR